MWFNPTVRESTSIVAEVQGMIGDDDGQADEGQAAQKRDDSPTPQLTEAATQTKANASAHQQETAREQRIRKIAERRRSERRKRTVKFWIESMSGLAAVAIAVLTVAYVHYSGAQWRTMRQQLELSERPWVNVSGWPYPSYDLAASDIFKIPISFANSGHQPALHTKPLFFSLLGAPATEKYPWAPNTAPTVHVCEGRASEHPTYMEFPVFPNTSYSVDTDQRVIPQSEVDKVLTARSTLYVVGCIYYDDSLGNRYKTDVCLYWLRDKTKAHSGQFRFCPTNNRTTKNEDPE